MSHHSYSLVKPVISFKAQIQNQRPRARSSNDKEYNPTFVSLFFSISIDSPAKPAKLYETYWPLCHSLFLMITLQSFAPLYFITLRICSCWCVNGVCSYISIYIFYKWIWPASSTPMILLWCYVSIFFALCFDVLYLNFIIIFWLVICLGYLFMVQYCVNLVLLFTTIYR